MLVSILYHREALSPHSPILTPASSKDQADFFNDAEAFARAWIEILDERDAEFRLVA